MKIREILDFYFALCTLGDSIDHVLKRMISKGLAAIVVVDENNTYRGVLTIPLLLKHMGSREQKIDSLVVRVKPVFEYEDTKVLKKAEFEMIPVINGDENVVGVITMKSLVEYMAGGPGQLLSRGNEGSHKFSGKHGAKYTIDDIVGISQEILLLKERIIAAAKTASTVLIMGETGTGKELAAHAITNLSERRHQSFVRINCAAIPENLLESELFGYEQGAFTGAVKGGHSGKFLLADKGTIFLDEIGDMPLSLQAKILRVLQEKEIEKIGGYFPVPIDVRVIAATHADLYELVKTKAFRQDLFYRLHVIPIHIPPLREHKEDIPLLVGHLVEKFAATLKLRKPEVHPTFLNKLVAYHWPGNIRELSNVVEMAVSFSNGVITEEHIPKYIEAENQIDDENAGCNVLKSTTEETERDMILKALDTYRGNKNKVAEALGISRSNLYYKMKKLNIEGS